MTFFEKNFISGDFLTFEKQKVCNGAHKIHDKFISKLTVALTLIIFMQIPKCDI